MKYSLRSLTLFAACLGAIFNFAGTVAWFFLLAWITPDLPSPPPEFVAFSLVFTTFVGAIVGALFPWALGLIRKLL
jgi:hypothetical protein